MAKALRYNYNNTLAGDVFSPITEHFAFAKGKRYFVSSLDERGAYLMDSFSSNGFVSSRERFITWPSLNACFSKYNPKTGELDPIPEPEERAVYVSDHERYLASIGAKSKHMIPDEIREKQELADAELLASSLRTDAGRIGSETKGRNPFVPIKRRVIPQPGKYGEVELVSSSDDKASVRISPAFYLTSEQLREAAHVLNQLAEILEENARNG